MFTVLDQLVYSGTHFVISIALARALSIEGYGTFVLLFSVWLFFYFVQRGLINEPMFVLRNKDGGAHARRFGVLQLYYIGGALLLLGLLGGVAVHWSTYLDYPTWAMFSLAVASLLFREFVRSYLIADGRSATALTFDLSYFFAIGILFAYQWYGDIVSLKLYWADVTGASVLTFLLFVPTYSTVFLHRDYGVPSLDREGVSSWNTLVNVSMWLYGNAYKYVVAFLVGPSGVAVIAACQNIKNMADPVINGIQNHGVVKLASAGSTFTDTFRRLGLLITLAAVGFAVPMVVIPGVLLDWAYGGRYSGHPVILMAYGVNIVLTAFGRVFHIQLLAESRTRMLMRVYSFSLPLSMIMLVLLISSFELEGMAIYLVLSAALFAVLARRFASHGASFVSRPGTRTSSFGGEHRELDG